MKRMPSMLVALALLCGTVTAAEVSVNARSAVDYLLSCQKENGAFGPVNQNYSEHVNGTIGF